MIATTIATTAATMMTKMRDNEVIRMQIPGELRYVGIARQAVDAVSEQLHLPGDARMAVKLAVGEACNNAVLYAKRGGAAQNSDDDGSDNGSDNGSGCEAVVIACRVRPDVLEIDVTNEGNGFHPGPPAPMPAGEDLAEHGRGMALMEMVMDSVEYLSDNGNTTVRMRKRLPSDAPREPLPC